MAVFSTLHPVKKMTSNVFAFIYARSKYKVLRPAIWVVENIKVGLRMTIKVRLFLCERPVHVFILRPTLIIKACYKFGRRTLNWLFLCEQPLHVVILRPTPVIKVYHEFGRRTWILFLLYHRILKNSFMQLELRDFAPLRSSPYREGAKSRYPVRSRILVYKTSGLKGFGTKSSKPFILKSA